MVTAKAGMQGRIQEIVATSQPERLSDPGKHPIADDHVANVVQLAGWGQSGLAADHLLFPEPNGSLSAVVGGIIRRLHLRFIGARLERRDSADEVARKLRIRQYAYETLLEMTLNFAGMEGRWLEPAERSQARANLRNALTEWEALEAGEGNGSVAEAVVRRMLGRMRPVQKGLSMVAKTALRIEQALDYGKPFLLDFLDKACAEIETNVYTRMVRENLCRFGNDYALGLRWLRHLGFEQVSTNPVLAALAYADDPSLAQTFLAEAKFHPDFTVWKAAPTQHADEIALYATLLALWENLHVYRPVFFNLAGTSGGGVVSFQLNPNIAHLVQESIRDVFAAFAAATEDLAVYDAHLLAGYRPLRERGRPNLVIKVAASSPAACEIARRINSCGFGSNVTVVYTVAQEVTMVLEELAGMAAAIKKGIPPTQLYMTNMGGRFESHLREVKLESLFSELKQQQGAAGAVRRVEALAVANGTKPQVSQAKGYEAKVVAATRAGSQRTIDENIAVALEGVATADELRAWEEVIQKAGTIVARRVWGLFWSEENRAKWTAHLMLKYQLTQEQASLILGRVCYLPAAKRSPQHTLWALSRTNMVHTELPAHQENVRQAAEAPHFRMADYAESITQEFPADVLARLRTIPDFRTGYELNPMLNQILQEVGIPGDFGTAGHTPQQWADFGAVRKTLADFTAAYDKFRADMVALIKSMPEQSPSASAQPLKKRRLAKRIRRQASRRIR